MELYRIGNRVYHNGIKLKIITQIKPKHQRLVYVGKLHPNIKYIALKVLKQGLNNL